MGIYTKKTFIGGKWLDKNQLITGQKAKIKSETNEVPSTFKNEDGSPQMQDVCSVHVEGQKEPMNMSLNRTTIYGLVDAFGEDSKNWIDQLLTVSAETSRVGGKKRITVYLIPEGYKLIDDENGYAVIVPKDHKEPEKKEVENEIKPDEVPF